MPSPPIQLFGRAGTLVVLAFVVLGLVGAAVAAAAGTVAQRVRAYTDISLPQAPPGAQTTFVYDRNGRLITTLHAEKNRVPIPLSEIPESMKQATVAIEDKDYYRHGGISAEAILRAAWENVTNAAIEQGGSTITQQYVKNVYTGAEQTFSRKIREALLAMKLEKLFSKEEILGKYLNTVYFGHGAYGVEAAAQTYFGIPAKDLSVLQSATLAGLIQLPARYDPIRRPKAARSRRNVVLEEMAEQGYLTSGRADYLSKKGLFVIRRESKVSPYPYFVQLVTKQLLNRYGYEKTFAGGLGVHTTLDPRQQQAAEDAVESHLPLATDPDAALVAMDPRTGEIRALVGGRDFTTAKFNLATQALRQTGSAFKPFTLTAAMEQRISPYSTWSGPSEMVIDDERCLTDGEPWEVHTYGDESVGTMNLISATAGSVNTIFAQLVLDVGPEAVVDVAKRMGIRSDLQPVCSITLGSQDVSPLDMTTAFSTLADGGIRHPPVAIARVNSSNGRAIDEAPMSGYRAIEENDAAIVTYALQQVVSGGTGTAAALGDRPVAGKTGTAQNYQDAWFCGYTPQLAACVWMGYHRGEIPMENVEGFPQVFGGSIPAMIWHDFMTVAMAGQPVVGFATPSFTGYDEWPDHAYVPPPPPPSPSESPSPAPSPTEPSPSPSPKEKKHKRRHHGGD